jgi:hypothetical protein
MSVIVSEKEGVYIEEVENKNVLEVEKIKYPLGTNYATTYWDGIQIIKGEKKAKVFTYGGGNGWARRGSMTERWREFITFITSEEFDKLVQRVEEISKIQNEIDREAELKDFVESVFNKFDEI